MCAAQAIDLLAPLEPGPGTGAGRAVIREFAPTLERDRYLAPELEAAAEAVAAGRFAAIVRGRSRSASSRCANAAKEAGMSVRCDVLVRGASEVVTMVPGAGEAPPAGPGAAPVDLGVIPRGAVARPGRPCGLDRAGVARSRRPSRCPATRSSSTSRARPSCRASSTPTRT